jgi:hypothetical protein
MTALSCRDPFGDCGHHHQEELECRHDIDAVCGACPEGSVLQGCGVSGGDCDIDYETAICERGVRAGTCPDVATCLGSGDAYGRCRS